MGAISDIFGSLVTQIGDVELDANLSEVVNVSNSVTSHPVEDGSVIADHIIEEPDEISIDGVFTNTPADIIGALTASSTRAEDLYNELLEHKEKKELISVFTSKAEYEDMVITRLSRNRSSGSGESVHFSVTLVKIVKVQSETVEAPTRTETDAKKPKKDLGKKPKTPADSTQSATTLSKLLF